MLPLLSLQDQKKQQQKNKIVAWNLKKRVECELLAKSEALGKKRDEFL